MCTASPYTQYITNIYIKSIKVSAGKCFMYEYELKPSSILKFKLKKTSKKSNCFANVCGHVRQKSKFLTQYFNRCSANVRKKVALCQTSLLYNILNKVKLCIIVLFNNISLKLENFAMYIVYTLYTIVELKSVA